MPRQPQSPQVVEAQRDRIVEAAASLFAQRGYAAVTMRAIGTSLGVSPMAAYRYFKDKAEIFAMVRADAFRRFADTQQEAYQSSPRVVPRLLAMRDAYFDFALAEPELYRIMFELGQPKDGPEELSSQHERSFEYLRLAVADAVEAGFMQGDPLTLAHMLWSQVHGLVTLHLAGKLTHGRGLKELRMAPSGVLVTVDE